MKPKVSIVTPLYNKRDFIKETAESVLSQTMAEFEWIVIDNGSTDEGPEVIRSIEDQRVALLQHDVERGPGTARNAGLTAATGDWIFFLDADDLITPNHLEELITRAQSTESDIVVSDWVEENATCSDSGTCKNPPPKGTLSDITIASAPWVVHSALIRRDKTPRWPEHLDQFPGEDIAYWFAAIQQCRVEYTENDHCGAIYRTSTSENRTGTEGGAIWFRGIDAAINENVNLAGELTHGQCEALVRVYMSIYRLARKQDYAEVAEGALATATRWLRLRSKMPQPLGPPMRLRAMLGLRLYNTLFRR